METQRNVLQTIIIETATQSYLIELTASLPTSSLILNLKTV